VNDLKISLCLFIPGPEFVVVLLVWLEITFLSLSPLCMYFSTIDHCGDHLLECSQGSVCIHQHSALVDILFYHALPPSHTGVRKEQRISGDNQS